MLKIGLTGGIGSGKTTVSDCFERLGVPIIDADVVSRQLVQQGLPAYEKIVQTFGERVVGDDARLNRAELRRLIFSDEAKKHQLEAILHPLIRQEIKDQISQLDYVYCIIVIPLLLESNQLSLVDRVLVVDTDVESQIFRTQNRDGNSRMQVEAIIKSQVDRKTRIASADDILTNNGDRLQLKKNIEKIHLEYLSLLRQPI